MACLVTLEEVRDHLRVDTYADDPWIEMMIPAISGAVLSWLKDDWRAYLPALDSSSDAILDEDGNPIPKYGDDGNPVVKPQVKAAVLVEISQHYRFRDGSGAASVPSHWGHGYVLGVGATSLLVALRRSTVV